MREFDPENHHIGIWGRHHNLAIIKSNLAGKYYSRKAYYKRFLGNGYVKAQQNDSIIFTRSHSKEQVDYLRDVD